MNCRSNYQFNRVSRELPCPVCAHDHWCMISPFGERAVCRRVQSGWPAPPFSGWYHEIPPRRRPSPVRIAEATKAMVPHEIRDFGELHRQLIAQFDEGQRERAAAALGLDPCVFDLYPIGFDATLDALAFPAMQATTPRIIGIRYRRILPSTGSSKWTCQPESTAGLLLPSTPPLAREPIFLLEGPSDTLAAAQIGLYAIGRWSCSLDSRQASTLKAHLSGVERPTVIVIGDNDARLTGERGADAAANIVSEVLPVATVADDQA